MPAKRGAVFARIFFLLFLITVAVVAEELPQGHLPGGLKVTVLDDRTFHFGEGHSDYIQGFGAFSGPQQLRFGSDFVETAELRLERYGLGYRVLYQDREVVAFSLDGSTARLRPTGQPYLYGLGEQFLKHRLGQFDGDWRGEVRSSGPYGNEMHGYFGGAVGNAQFPVLYAVEPKDVDFLFFLDNPQAQEWDFRLQPWTVQALGGPMRGVVSVDQLPALRRRFMELTGKPPVPPSKAFGLWVSEYGFENWEELDEKLASLRRNGFPLDGFVLDLQWFGGVEKGSPKTSMGTLTFDRENFPDPEQKVADLAAEGVGIIPIEEAYVGADLEEHARLADKGFLVRAQPSSNEPLLINVDPWWGLGGMLDYTSRQAAAFWHDWKRQPLVEMRVAGHWTDLGEPEAYEHKTASGQRVTGFYEGGRTEAEVHNLFAHRWARSIAEGYRRHQMKRRPFMVTRTGGPGIQRYGAALWSGDIPTRFTSLASHFNAALHLGLSGIDYFGSDIGGFYRSAFRGDGQALDELYTQWFAAACAFDVPVRPHTMNLANRYETAPDRIGDRESNLANLRQRYRLLPYYYSLAHRAHRTGEPVFAPLFYYDDIPPPDEEEVFVSGSERFIGKDMLVKMVARSGARRTDVYLPPGRWFDFHSGRQYDSSGGRFDFSLYQDGLYQLPRLVRAGAIIPTALVGEDFRGSHDVAQAPIELKLYAPLEGQMSRRQLVFDDGWSVAYIEGDYRQTEVTMTRQDDAVEVEIRAAVRPFQVELSPEATKKVSGVVVDGRYQREPQVWLGDGGDHRLVFELESR